MESILSLEKGFLFIGVFFAVSLFVIMDIMLDLWYGVYTKAHGDHSGEIAVSFILFSF